MVTGLPSLPPEVFLDTSFVVALAVRTDENHARVLRTSQVLRPSRTRMITTQAILLEISNAFANQPFRKAEITIQENLAAGPHVSILPVTETILRRAWSLFAERKDREWGVTDCLSFVAMHDLGLTVGLTADHHFEQAGFRAILREGYA